MTLADVILTQTLVSNLFPRACMTPTLKLNDLNQHYRAASPADRSTALQCVQRDRHRGGDPKVEAWVRHGDAVAVPDGLLPLAGHHQLT